MTRKDFELIAGILNQNGAGFSEGDEGYTLTRILAAQFANALEQENPRFNRERFLAACGVKI